MTSWDGRPAIGVALVRLTALMARAQRVRAERDARKLATLAALVARKDDTP